MAQDERFRLGIEGSGIGVGIWIWGPIGKLVWSATTRVFSASPKIDADQLRTVPFPAGAGRPRTDQEAVARSVQGGGDFDFHTG